MIPSGPCWIFNAKHAISIALLGPASGSSLTSTVSSEPTAMWNLEPVGTDRFTIRNVLHQTYAGIGPSALADSEVCAGSEPQVWVVTRTDMDAEYIISTSDGELCWNLENGEEGTKVVVASKDVEESNRWSFVPVPEHLRPLNLHPIHRDNEPATRSIHSNIPTRVTFINRLPDSVHLWWRDFEGRRVSYGAVGPDGDTKEMLTYVTHPWVITNETTEEVIGIWHPAPRRGLIEIKLEDDYLAGSD
ncbi:hypothetical protein CPB86DRAFT_796007 [Serendipita vermifera]|nr:hypothetical protein CPB86DRAFT_796007 [Serendipita vermifera]